MDEATLERLADLVVGFGANVQQDQIVSVSCEPGKEALTRAIAASAYRRGARFVDIAWFDPWVKRARIEHAREETLDFVPDWYGSRILALGEQRAARIGLSGPSAPGLLEDLDPVRAGKDRLPAVKESGKVVNDRTTNWSIIPCSTPVWASLVLPACRRRRRRRRSTSGSCTCCGSMSRIRSPPGASAPTRSHPRPPSSPGAASKRCTTTRRAPTSRSGCSPVRNGTRRASRRSTASSTCPISRPRRCSRRPTRSGPTAMSPRASRSCLPTGPWCAGCGCASRAAGWPRSTPTPHRTPCARSSQQDDGATRLGEVALVDDEGRIGKLDTVFYDTLIDENAASHIALGQGFPFLLPDDQRDRANESEIHIDFMIGSPEMTVTGITREGDRVPVLVRGKWQL